MKHVPNALTVGRIVVTPLCLWGLASGSFGGQLAGTAGFILAAISDYWDGRLARQYGVGTRFGQFLDPLADKVLVLGAFFVLKFIEPVGDWMPWWALGLIAARDLAVTLLRAVRERQNRPLRTSNAAKWKTAWQLTFLITIQVLLVGAHARSLDGALGALGRILYDVLDGPFTLVFLLLTTAATLYTGVQYFPPASPHGDRPAPRRAVTDAARATARDLLAVGAVTLRPHAPFTWASGWKSPIYCDNRLTMADPAVRGRLTDGFEAVLAEHGLSPDTIAGTATAGIPHAAWLADRTRLPMVYVRSRPKEHGRGNQIEGRLPEGARVVLVEDTVSTGGSSLQAVEALRSAGAEVLAVVAIFAYRFPQAERAFEAARVPLHALTDYDALIEEAEASGLVAPDDRATLAAWRASPERWGVDV